MDSTKKYLYFNTTADAHDGGYAFPVSTLVGIETTNTDEIVFYFKEAVQTDTSDMYVSTTNGVDPKAIMEHIVEQINFSKDSMLVIADDFTGQTIHPDITGVSSLSVANRTDPVITFGSNVHVFNEKAADAGDGFRVTGWGVNNGTVGMVNGEIVTTLFIELDGLTCDSAGNKVIGIDGSDDPAYITQITTAKNGIIYRGEMICVEVGTGASGEISNVIDLVANTSGDIDPGEDAATSGTILIDQGGSYTLAEMRTFDSSLLADANPSGTIPAGGIQDQYLYLSVASSSQTGGDYTGGKYLIRLYGAPTSNLNDIS